VIKQLLKESDHGHPKSPRLEGGFGGGIPGRPLFSHESIGELTHEDNIVINGQKSAGASI